MQVKSENYQIWKKKWLENLNSTPSGRHGSQGVFFGNLLLTNLESKFPDVFSWEVTDEFQFLAGKYSSSLREIYGNKHELAKKESISHPSFQKFLENLDNYISLKSETIFSSEWADYEMMSRDKIIPDIHMKFNNKTNHACLIIVYSDDMSASLVAEKIPSSCAYIYQKGNHIIIPQSNREAGIPGVYVSTYGEIAMTFPDAALRREMEQLLELDKFLSYSDDHAIENSQTIYFHPGTFPQFIIDKTTSDIAEHAIAHSSSTPNSYIWGVLKILNSDDYDFDIKMRALWELLTNQSKKFDQVLSNKIVLRLGDYESKFICEQGKDIDNIFNILDELTRPEPVAMQEELQEGSRFYRPVRGDAQPIEPTVVSPFSQAGQYPGVNTFFTPGIPPQPVVVQGPYTTSNVSTPAITVPVKSSIPQIPLNVVDDIEEDWGLIDNAPTRGDLKTISLFAYKPDCGSIIQKAQECVQNYLVMKHEQKKEDGGTLRATSLMYILTANNVKPECKLFVLDALVRKGVGGIFSANKGTELVDRLRKTFETADEKRFIANTATTYAWSKGINPVDIVDTQKVIVDKLTASKSGLNIFDRVDLDDMHVMPEPKKAGFLFRFG